MTFEGVWIGRGGRERFLRESGFRVGSGVLFASIEESYDGRTVHYEALVRTPRGFVEMSSTTDGEGEMLHTEQRSIRDAEEAALWLLGRVDDRYLEGFGRVRQMVGETVSSEEADILIGEIGRLLTSCGARLGWVVEALGGQWEDSWRHVVAVYSDPALAVTHAEAEKTIAAGRPRRDPESEQEEVEEDAKGWLVSPVILRDVLPERLRQVA